MDAMQNRPVSAQTEDGDNGFTADWEHPIDVVVSPNLTLTTDVRLTREEVRVLSAAAAAANLPLNRYLIDAAMQVARQTQK